MHETILELAERLGITEVDLDDKVIDLAVDADLESINAVVDAEELIEDAEQAGASINNAGLETQLDFLLSCMGYDELRSYLIQQHS